MENKNDGFDYFESLKEGLQDIVAYQHGDKSRVRIHVRKIAEPRFRAHDVQTLRLKLRLSQAALAAAMGVSSRTVEAWETGVNVPNGTAQHLLYLFEKQPDLVENLIVKAK